MLLPPLPVAADPAVTVVVAAFVLSALCVTLLAPVSVTLLPMVASELLIGTLTATEAPTPVEPPVAVLAVALAVLVESLAEVIVTSPPLRFTVAPAPMLALAASVVGRLIASEPATPTPAAALAPDSAVAL